MMFRLLTPIEPWSYEQIFATGDRPGRKPLTREQKRKRRELKQTKRRIRKIRGKN